MKLDDLPRRLEQFSDCKLDDRTTERSRASRSIAWPGTWRRRADRAALARSGSRPTVLAEQDCTTTRPIRAVLAAGVVRRALSRDCKDPGRRNCGGRRALSGGGLFALRGALVRLQSERSQASSALTPAASRCRRALAGVPAAPQSFRLRAEDEAATGGRPTGRDFRAHK